MLAWDNLIISLVIFIHNNVYSSSENCEGECGSMHMLTEMPENERGVESGAKEKREGGEKK